MRGPERHEFGDFELDAAERRLARNGRPVALPPKTFDVLLALVRNAGRLVTRPELLDRVWPDCFVDENIVAVHVSTLRKALGAEWIETAPKAGYRFRGPAASPEPAPRLRPDVFEQFGRGRAYLFAATREDVPRAIAAFQAAIGLDSGYAAAHAALALAYCQQAQLRVAPHREAHDRARAAALQALAIDPASADAQTALGTVLFLGEWQWAAAERCFQRALHTNPDHSEALLQYGSLMEARGRPDRALELKQKALARDPLSALTLLQISVSYLYARRYDDAIQWANKALAVDPRHLFAREHLAAGYWAKRDYDRHMQINLEHAETFGAPRDLIDSLRRIYDEGGRPAVLRYAIAHANPQSHFQLAILHAEAGDRDTAFAHLERATAQREPCLAHLAVAPQWDPLRGDPRFEEALRRIGYLPVV